MIRKQQQLRDKTYKQGQDSRRDRMRGKQGDQSMGDLQQDQQGLRDGTLPQLFKDEIEKSWQEYVEQVGQEVAKSTPFWAEALNEILAGGNKVF